MFEEWRDVIGYDGQYQVSNLECLSSYENNNHGTINIRVPHSKRNTRSKRINQLSLDGKFIRGWVSGHEIKRSLGFDNAAIARVCRGKKKNAYGFRWEFTEDE